MLGKHTCGAGVVVVVVCFPLDSGPRLSRPRAGAGARSSSCARADTATHATKIKLENKHTFINIELLKVTICRKFKIKVSTKQARL